MRGIPGPTTAAELAVTAPPQRPGKVTEGSNTMLALKYLLMILGLGLFGSAGALVVYDIYISEQLRRLLARRKTDESAAELGKAPPRPFGPVRWGLAQRLAASGVLPLLLALSIVVIPDGAAGVRISQIWGARPGTLYPGVHLITPLVDSVELYDTREQVYSTIATESAKQKGDVLTRISHQESIKHVWATELWATRAMLRQGSCFEGMRRCW